VRYDYRKKDKMLKKAERNGRKRNCEKKESYRENGLKR
jgi:hypothetical protein